MKNIAVFGGSFSPLGLHHRQLIEKELVPLPYIDRIVVVPCGMRPDKVTTSFVPTIHRTAMVVMALEGIPKVTVDLSDLENDTTFTPTIELEHHYATPDTEVWYVVGSDLVAGGARGESAIQRTWRGGHELWNNSRFIVFHRPGVKISEADLPPHHRLIKHDDIPTDASSEIREIIFNGKPFEHLVTPRVADYIKRYGLYRGSAIGHTGVWMPPTDREIGVECFWNSHKRNARRMAKDIGSRFPLTDKNPDFIVSLGGDGRLLQTIRDNWHRHIPFLGLNVGHYGFLLNSPSTELNQRFTAFHLPMLHVEIHEVNGNVRHEVAFNDVWMERSGRSTAWIRVDVDGKRRLTKLEADGILVATPQGSSAYARSMGASPIPLNSQALILVGNNVARPQWRSAILPTDSIICATNLKPKFRPTRVVIDGSIEVADVERIIVRRSNTAAVELLFDPTLDIGGKIVATQFPT